MDQGGNGILVFALYNKIYEDDEDYYSYPIQAVDQGENGILVFALYNNKIYETTTRILFKLWIREKMEY